MQSGLFYVIDQISAVLNKVLSCSKWHDFLLSDLLALYPMPQIKSSQGSDCYSFISELPMEDYSPFLHGEPGPPLESNRRYQKVYMLLYQASAPTVYWL